MEGIRKTTGSLARCPGRYSIQAPPDYESARWNLLALTLIIIRTKFVHRCTSFEKSAPENVCVVWIICTIVACILSSASIRKLERKLQDSTELSWCKYEFIILTHQENKFYVHFLHVFI